MLLAIDAGNTQTVFGLFQQDSLESSWRVATRQDCTEDELGVQLTTFLRNGGFDPSSIDGIIISSVVPDIDTMLRRTCQRYIGIVPLFVEPGVKTGLPILYDNPHEVGADRIVNSVAAIARFGAPVMVLDFGTATTLDVVNEKGEYLGGMIAPGLHLSAEALFRRAARLTRVEIVKPERTIGRTTKESLQSGLFHGYASLVEGLITRARDELGVEAPVIATGGLASIFMEQLSIFSAVDKDLTLTGLHQIWEKNSR